MKVIVSFQFPNAAVLTEDSKIRCSLNVNTAMHIILDSFLFHSPMRGRSLLHLRNCYAGRYWLQYVATKMFHAFSVSSAFHEFPALCQSHVPTRDGAGTARTLRFSPTWMASHSETRRHFPWCVPCRRPFRCGYLLTWTKCGCNRLTLRSLILGLRPQGGFRRFQIHGVNHGLQIRGGTRGIRLLTDNQKPSPLCGFFHLPLQSDTRGLPHRCDFQSRVGDGLEFNRQMWSISSRVRNLCYVSKNSSRIPFHRNPQCNASRQVDLVKMPRRQFNNPISELNRGTPCARTFGPPLGYAIGGDMIHCPRPHRQQSNGEISDWTNSERVATFRLSPWRTIESARISPQMAVAKQSNHDSASTLHPSIEPQIVLTHRHCIARSNHLGEESVLRVGIHGKPVADGLNMDEKCNSLECTPRGHGEAMENFPRRIAEHEYGDGIFPFRSCHTLFLDWLRDGTANSIVCDLLNHEEGTVGLHELVSEATSKTLSKSGHGEKRIMKYVTGTSRKQTGFWCGSWHKETIEQLISLGKMTISIAAGQTCALSFRILILPDGRCHGCKNTQIQIYKLERDQ